MEPLMLGLAAIDSDIRQRLSVFSFSKVAGHELISSRRLELFMIKMKH
ncbi:Conserved hypothetical protein [Prochlorococcus marinus str. MIT 9313]|uniref:Uncharacterized protein n=1 Tax=Prochlorococcus marinus (strain MIT 9313) TaxID=74547 RepID=B9ES48_PROMM|nr:Conserved hypothetical protein [Prochlorococcus marinus str. MIT 9313]